jgi:GNAT superfamily N-acetyltransferase
MHTQDLETPQSFSIRPMRRGEISLAVNAYGEMLKETEQFDEVDLIYSERNLETCRILLEHHYNIGNVCHVAEVDNLSVGYASSLQNVTFDLKDARKVYCGFFLYVEPEYRKLGIGVGLIQATLDFVESMGGTKFHCNFISERESSQMMVARFGLVANPLQVTKFFQ